MSLANTLNLKDDEQLLTVARAAPVTQLFPAIGIAILLLTPFFFLRPLLRWLTLGYIIIGVLLALGFFLGLRQLVKWLGSFLAVTDRRLIVVRRRGFFEREVTELPYAKVQEISYRVKGLTATVFGYGTLIVETAGSDEPLEMHRLHRPSALHELIADLQEEGARGRGDFGEMLQAVSRLDRRRLGMLKAEIDRTLRALPEDDAETL